MGQGLFAASKFGVNVKFRVKIGHQTGRQAFSTWTDNQEREHINRARRTLFKAAAYARTTIRRGMRKSGQPVKDPERAGWYSYRPSQAGAPPRYRKTGNRSNLKYVTFTKPTTQNLKSIVGPEVFPSKSGKRVNFKVAKMLERGGTGLVYLPVHPDQNPVWSNTLSGGSWPMAWMPSKYPARPFVKPAVKPTLKQFPLIFARTK